MHTVAGSDEGGAARLELEAVDEQVEGNNVSGGACSVVLVRREAAKQNSLSAYSFVGFKSTTTYSFATSPA